MIVIGSFGFIIFLILIFGYTAYIVYNDVINSEESLRNTEHMHRFLLIIGGLLLGFGIGSWQVDLNEIDFVSDSFVLSILFIIAGIFAIMMGIVLLNNQLWKPLIDISEYSAEFGSNFIATRLPETGGKELERFAERFNGNVINLANDISILEIKVHKLTENVDNTIVGGRELVDSTSNLSDLAIQYNNLTDNQSTVVNNISKQIGEFAQWYESTNEKLEENFIELRSISEMGNLIAINAAVEASNLEIPNPGFETLASKLRDLARGLEERQESLRRIMDDVTINYAEFSNSIQENVRKASKLSSNTSNLGAQVDNIIQKIKQKEMVFIDNYNELERSIHNFKESIPTAYID